MAKQDNSESPGSLAAELALLRQRVARLEETIHQMMAAGEQVRPPEPPLPTAAVSDTPPRVSPPPMPPEMLVPVEPPESDARGEQAAAFVGPPERPIRAEPAEPFVGPPELLIHAPPAPPAPGEPPAPTTKTAAPTRPAQSLEQTIGMRWMLFVGVGVLLLAAVFFFMYAIEQGWIGPHRRVLIGAITGLALLGAGEWALRRKMRLYAGAIGGAGVALLYLVIWVASPNGLYAEYHMLGESMTGAFLLMCVVTLIGVAVALRSNIQPTAIISLVGALATPALLSSGRDRQVLLMTYLLIVDAGFLAIAWRKAWRALLPIAMTGTGVLFMLWFAAHYPSEGLGWSVTSMFGWAFFAMFVACGAWGVACGRISPKAARTVVSVSAGALVLLWLAQRLDAALAAQMLVLSAITLTLCVRHRWRVLARIVMGVAGTVFMMRFATDASARSLGWFGTSAFGWAFWGLFVAYAAVGSPRGWIARQNAIVATGISAAAMVVLWRLRNLDAAMAAQLLVLSAITLAVCVWRRWRDLAVMVMAAAGAVFTVRFGVPKFRMELGSFGTCAYAWAMFALFVGYAAVGSLRDWISRKRAIVTTAASAGAMTLVWLGHDLHGALAGQLLALNAIVLALCVWREWQMLRTGPLAWTIVAMATEWWRVKTGHSSLGPVTWGLWAWALYALATADVVLRIRRADLPRIEWLDPAIATAAMAAMFAGTYRLLDVDYHAQMGLYAAGLGAAAIAAAWLVTVRGQWRKLGYAYFGQGLVLVALAVPIQFDQSMVTIAWAAQGVVAMLLARLLASRALMGKSVVLLALAAGHFLCIALRQDPRLADVAMSVGGVSVSLGLLLAMGLTAGVLGAVAMLRAGKAIWDEQFEGVLACGMVGAAALFFFARTITGLPTMASTWWCMVLSTGLAAWGLVRRSRWLTLAGGAAVLVCAAKWLMHDTLGRRMGHGAIVDVMVVMNWQFWAGLALSAILLAYARAFKRRGIKVILANGTDLKRTLDHLCIVLACIIILWAGSFEIDRFFAGSSPDAWANPGQARHMTFSLWWALWAAVVLVIGFVASRPPLRYLALGVFAITLGKVFIVDMRQVRTVYRILSFLGLGVALLGGALLYNRRFIAAKAAEGEQESSAAPTVRSVSSGSKTQTPGDEKGPRL